MARRLYLTLHKMRTYTRNHIIFSAISQLSQVQLGELNLTKDTPMKRFLIPNLLTALLFSACATATPLDSPTPVPATDTSAPVTATAVETETTVPTAEAILPTDTSVPENTSPVSFTNQVLPIFETYCTRCHGGERIREGLNMTTYDGLMAGSDNGAVVVVGNANESLFIDLIVQGEMPERGEAPSSEEIQILIDWVNQGALNN